MIVGTRTIASLTIDRSDGGLWFVTSPEWRGLLLAHRDLSVALSQVVPAVEELHAAMVDWHGDPSKEPYGQSQLDQMERYALLKEEVSAAGPSDG